MYRFIMAAGEESSPAEFRTEAADSKIEECVQTAGRIMRTIKSIPSRKVRDNKKSEDETLLWGLLTELYGEQNEDIIIPIGYISRMTGIDAENIRLLLDKMDRECYLSYAIMINGEVIIHLQKSFTDLQCREDNSMSLTEMLEQYLRNSDDNGIQVFNMKELSNIFHIDIRSLSFALEIMESLGKIQIRNKDEDHILITISNEDNKI